MIQYYAEVTCDTCDAAEVFASIFGFVSARNAGWLLLAGKYLCPACQVSPLQGRHRCEGRRYGSGELIHLPEAEGGTIETSTFVFPLDTPAFQRVSAHHHGSILLEEERCGGFTRIRRRWKRVVATGRSGCASWIGRLRSGLRG